MSTKPIRIPRKLPTALVAYQFKKDGVPATCSRETAHLANTGKGIRKKEFLNCIAAKTRK